MESPAHRLQNLRPAPVTAYQMGVGGAMGACVRACLGKQPVRVVQCSYSCVSFVGELH